MDRTEKAMQDKNAETSNVEQVTAADLLIGDLIFMPNAHRSQTVVNIMEQDANGQKIRNIMTMDASWMLALEAPVRREVTA